MGENEFFTPAFFYTIFSPSEECLIYVLKLHGEGEKILIANNPKDPPTKIRKDHFLFFGWYIALAGLLSNAVGYGSRYSFSVIFPTLLEEFKWPRDTTAAMLSIHILVYGLFSPLAGYLIDRTGPKKAMLLGTILLLHPRG